MTSFGREGLLSKNMAKNSAAITEVENLTKP